MSRQLDLAIISIFPQMFEPFCKHGVVGKAVASGLVGLNLYNPRDYADDKHRTVDDRPYGGGAGMVMAAPPLREAVVAAKKSREQAKVIYLTPQGRSLDQEYLVELFERDQHIFVCGRYEGLDERFIQKYVDEECSLGDFVISGGELAAMVVVDALARLLPGVCGNYESVQEDSFYQGLLDYPHYTRPLVFEDVAVPEVLTSGDHQAIKDWRDKQRVNSTRLKRPDLLEVALGAHTDTSR